MKNVKISATLGIISLVCALLIALINMVTSPIIAANDKKTELETCKEIFEAYNEEKSVSKDLTGKNEAILKIIEAKDSNGEQLGTIYKVSGKNAYGTITLMVGINANNEVCQVEFIENGQSFASTVNNHVLSSYPSSESTDVHFGAYEKSNSEKVGALNDSKVASIDVKCGATYGATLVKELVTVALTDAKEAK